MSRLLEIAFRPKPRAPMETLSEVSVTVEAGVGTDARGRVQGRQVTVLVREDWQRACSEAGADLPWTTRRANLLIEGMSLVGSVGKTLRVGEVVLEITEETEPCQLMDKFHRGLRDALAPDWRGGASCRVVSGGTIRVGDSVKLDG